jgi:hypothetical protein
MPMTMRVLCSIPAFSYTENLRGNRVDKVLKNLKIPLTGFNLAKGYNTLKSSLHGCHKNIFID